MHHVEAECRYMWTRILLAAYCSMAAKYLSIDNGSQACSCCTADALMVQSALVPDTAVLRCLA